MSTQITKLTITIAVFVLLLGLGVGYYFGALVEKNKAGKIREEMLKEVFSSAVFVNNVSGKILDIASDGKFLIIEASNILGVNIPKDYQQKKVVVSPNTKINLNGIATDLFLSSPVTKKEIQFSDLKVGDNINIVFDFEDGKKSFLDKELTALEINVNR